LRYWGKQGSEKGHFEGPADVAVDSEGNVYVADWGNHRVQVFKNTKERLE
jgi:DNA-binding beta-propeller fold protein YncE